MNSTLIPIITLSVEAAGETVRLLTVNGISAYSLESPELSGFALRSVAVNVAQVKEAVAILESAMSPALHVNGDSKALHGSILIPVDLSEKSYLAVNLGFRLAKRLSATPVLLHTYVLQSFEATVSIVDNLAQQDMELASDRKSEEVQRLLFQRFCDAVRKRQKSGELPDIPFRSQLVEGLPEKVIDEFTRTHSPLLVVMATRDREARAQDLVGSVTAEVLDGCRTPLFTVTQGYPVPEIRSILNLVFFVNLDKGDLLSMERFLQIFDYPEVNITLIPVSDRFGRATEGKLDSLRAAMEKLYPSVKFAAKILPGNNFRRDFPVYIAENDIQLIIVQNKKKNIFSRLINPGIAHLLFYERDLPMVVLPLT